MRAFHKLLLLGSLVAVVIGLVIGSGIPICCGPSQPNEGQLELVSLGAFGAGLLYIFIAGLVSLARTTYFGAAFYATLVGIVCIAAGVLLVWYCVTHARELDLNFMILLPMALGVTTSCIGAISATVGMFKKSS